MSDSVGGKSETDKLKIAYSAFDKLIHQAKRMKAWISGLHDYQLSQLVEFQSEKVEECKDEYKRSVFSSYFCEDHGESITGFRTVDECVLGLFGGTNAYLALFKDLHNDEAYLTGLKDREDWQKKNEENTQAMVRGALYALPESVAGGAVGSAIAKSIGKVIKKGAEALTNEYFEGLQNYFGSDRIKRIQYDSILNQLRIIKEIVPELKDRLWSGVGTGEEFSVRGALKSRGRELNANLWESMRTAGTSRLQKASAQLAALSEKDRTTQLEKFTSESDAKHAAMHASPEYQSARGSQRRVMDQEFIMNLRQSPDIKAAAAYYAQKILSAEKTNDLLGSKDPDLILDALLDIRKNPRAHLPEGVKVDSALLSEIRENIPDPATLMQDEHLLPIKMRKTNRGKWVPQGPSSGKYEFIPIPRRIHGIWKGVPIGECVGGNCGSLEALTPERWAIVALKDSNLHFVEQNGSYLGFVEAVPGRVNGKTYATVRPAFDFFDSLASVFPSCFFQPCKFDTDTPGLIGGLRKANLVGQGHRLLFKIKSVLPRRPSAHRSPCC